MKLQIAFQGGGAKLALLLPVVDALLELEEKKELSITRVSGTSAGAIAAALTANKANMAALRQYLTGLSKDRTAFDRAIPKISSMSMIAKSILLGKLFLQNKPIANDKAAAQILEDALHSAGIKRDSLVQDLERTCLILSANVARHQTIIADGEDKLLQSLMDSTSLPFILRTTGDLIDGGILDNLPIEALLTPESPGSEYGEIVAVSFSEPGFLPPSTSALSLASKLLDAAMTNKTRSSRRLVGTSNVYDIPRVVGDLRVESFNVESFFKFVSDENAYKNVKSDALDWFRRFIQAKKSAAEAARKISIAAPDRNDASEVLKAQSRDLRLLAKAYHQHDSLVQTESVLEIVAHSLMNEGQPGKKDIVRFIDRFRSTGGPIHVFATRLFAANAADAEAKNIKIYNAKKEPVPFVSFGVMDEQEEVLWTLSCFLKPMLGPDEPDGLITVVQEQEVSDVMLPLRRQGSDYLGSIVSQAQIAERVEIRLCIPSSFGPLSLENGTVDAVSALGLPDDPFVKEAFPLVAGQRVEEVVEICPSNFTSYVWRAVDCKRNETVRVIYRREASPTAP